MNEVNEINEDAQVTQLDHASTHNDLLKIKVCANILQQQLSIHLFSIILTLSACIGLFILLAESSSFISVRVLLLLAITFGVYETLLSVRVGFDARLLSDLAWDDSSLQSLDDSLKALKLISVNKVFSTLDDRLISCMRLFKRQVAVSCLQLVCFIAASITALL